MNLEFESITLKNFLSFGNVEQTIPLNDKKYQLIVGYNKDKSDSADDRNGVGKSTIFEAIHYALFGKSIGNKVTLGTLVNNVNKKNMIVILKFKKNDVEYTIERGRSPNILRLLKNGENIITDESQGDSRETQVEIEKIIGMNEDVYNQIICLSCKVPIFLEQTTANQKQIIEQILGIDIISEKISVLKALIKETKNEFNNEAFKYNTVKTQNEALSKSIQKQIEDMNASKKQWIDNKKSAIVEIQNLIDNLEKIDIEEEEKNFHLLENYKLKEGVNQINQQKILSLSSSIQEYEHQINSYLIQLNELKKIDILSEKQAHSDNDLLKKEEQEYNNSKVAYELVSNHKKTLDAEFKRLTDIKIKISNELSKLKENICPTCGQIMNKDEIEKIKSEKEIELKSISNQIHKIDLEIMEDIHNMSLFKIKTFEYKSTVYKTMSEALEHENNVRTLEFNINKCKEEISKLKSEIDNIKIEDLGQKPICYYNNISEIAEHKSNLKAYKDSLDKLLNDNTNPYEQQEKSIEEMKKNILILDDSKLIQLQNEMIHQDVLLKLLNSPNSFIRTTILDKSLSFLNSKIMQYLAELGSMHIVTFNNDMSISIQQMGLTYGYVSSGEMGRIAVALIFAFRDVWETLNNCSINLMAIDEMIDRIGLDTSGVEMMVKCLKKKNDKNIMLVTHNDTLINQATNIMTLVKEYGFTEVI